MLPDELPPLDRVNVVGSSGSGKSTFTQRLAALLNQPQIETDEVFWGPNWSEPDDATFFAALEDRLASDSWVLDGNYTRTIPIKWRRVQTVIWLDLPYWQIAWQVFRRTMIRSIRQEELWAGNRESLRKAFFEKESVIYWSISNLRRVRRGYSRAMLSPEFQHINFVRLQSRQEVSQFLQRVAETRH